MRQSHLFTKVQKEDPKDEESLNARLLIRAGFIHKEMAGVYSLLPLGLRVVRNIEKSVRARMEEMGGQELKMTALQPRANWETTGRYADLDVLFRFTAHYSGNEYVLGPTHEEIVVPLMSKYLFSYRDLPVAVFQFQEKFRDEKRAKSGILRGREFLMKDLYSFHVDEADMDSYYEKMKGAYAKVFEDVGISDKTYLTFASGGTFSKYSHEFQTVTPAGEDKIFICDKCKIAVNEEVLGDCDSACPECGNKYLHEEKAIEVGNIFKLKDKYSKPFELKYKDAEGRENIPMMGCYGLGVTRLMGAIVEASHDDKGMIWPENVAPFRFHLVELGLGLGEKLYDQLIDWGFEVLYDDREMSAGEKFAEADLIGIPYRIIISPRTGDKAELKIRKNGETKLLEYGDIRQIQ